MAEPDDFSATLVVRFASSIPDISLSIPDPRTASIAHIVVLLRDQLPSESAALRIRLIYSGRILNPRTAISSALRLNPPPTDPKGKGKAPLDIPTIYLHASLSEPALSDSELALEREEATRIDSSLSIDLHPPQSTTTQDDVPGPRTQPQGFDRLLTAGLSHEEVAQLRSQFRAMQSFTHTPDTMPSAEEILLLEEAWLASDANSNVVGTGGALTGAEDSEVNDLLWGNIIGFFWPLGAIFWGLREEGVWSAQRGFAVMMGVFVNLGFGVVWFLSTF